MGDFLHYSLSSQYPHSGITQPFHINSAPEYGSSTNPTVTINYAILD